VITKVCFFLFCEAAVPGYGTQTGEKIFHFVFDKVESLSVFPLIKRFPNFRAKNFKYWRESAFTNIRVIGFSVFRETNRPGGSPRAGRPPRNLI